MGSCHNQRSDAPAASSASPTIDVDLKAVTAALAGVEPRPGRVLLFGSRARGGARPPLPAMLSALRFSKQLPGDSWWHHPAAPHLLEPNAPTDSHPYPLELDLPSWTLAADIDLRTWLYGFGEGIRVEAPIALREELLTRCRAMLAAHEDSAHGVTVRAARPPRGCRRPAEPTRDTWLLARWFNVC